MDGIFGVGVAEIIIVVLAMFIIGGPQNTAKWAREAGRWVRKAREAWGQMVKEMENELGPEGKELMEVTRELGKGARDVRNMSSAKSLMGNTLRMVEDSVRVPDEKTPAGGAPAATPAAAKPVVSSNGSGASGTSSSGSSGDSSSGSSDSSSVGGRADDDSSKYRAWLPPEAQD